MDKLKSRKLWVATIGMFTIVAGEITSVTNAVTSIALAIVIAAYVGAQGLVDRSETNNKAIKEQNEILAQTMRRVGSAPRQEKDDGYELYQG